MRIGQTPAMAEDWRVTVTLPTTDDAEALTKALHEEKLDEEVDVGLDRVAVSVAEDRIYLYADTRLSAQAAMEVVRDVAVARGLQPTFQLDRWHPIEERWEDARVELPDDAAEQAAEHERREADETADSQTTGIADWEVRVEFPSHQAAAAFAEREEAEHQAIVRRWKYVLIGVNDEDDARALATRLKDELPDAIVHVEPGSGVAWEFYRDRPFAVFGGLAG
jgi:chemotaxis regulatin CheY-phosphate phosphatase CheZ